MSRKTCWRSCCRLCRYDRGPEKRCGNRRYYAHVCGVQRGDKACRHWRKAETQRRLLAKGEDLWLCRRWKAKNKEEAVTDEPCALPFKLPIDARGDEA